MPGGRSCGQGSPLASPASQRCCHLSACPLGHHCFLSWAHRRRILLFPSIVSPSQPHHLGRDRLGTVIYCVFPSVKCNVFLFLNQGT